jgi:molybdopterin molybdotransferase
VISVNEAIQIVLEKTDKLAPETVALEQALGRILAQDIVADSDLPPFDRSQMDGYAIRAEDATTTPARLQIVGESAAGRGWHEKMETGQAVRIMTGAPVPAGADSVQQVELTREVDGEVEILQSVAAGRSIVRRGEEIKKGQTVLSAGDRLTAGAIPVLASFGYANVEVGGRPRVAVMATGTELVSVDQKPGPDQIRDSNNFAISAYAHIPGAVVEKLPLAGDDTELLKRQISEVAERSDLVITSGGVSVGIYDFTKSALKEMGAEIFFERVRLRPGKPTVFARLPTGALFFGLPGNPVSVSVTFNLFARAAILKMQGAGKTDLVEATAFLEKPAKGAMERASYLPATLRTNDEAQLLAQPLRWGGSSDFVSFAKATALIVIPQDVGTIEAGTKVRVLRLPE